MDARFAQAHLEARYALCLAITYLLMWLMSGKMGSLTQGMTGLPQWFEFSCILVPLLFIFLAGWMIYTFFSDLSLSAEPGKSTDESQ